MHILHVFIHVKNDKVEEFKAATVENARSSLKEPGVVRFDLLQEMEDPTRFLLVEIYKTPEAAVKHKETNHYKHWHEIAGSLMIEPRTRISYRNVFPDELGWV